MLVAVPVMAVVMSSAPLAGQDSVAVEKRTADYITREQLTTQTFSNLYELVESMHNNWLREGIPSPGPCHGRKPGGHGGQGAIHQ